jgi:hypothetical protein
MWRQPRVELGARIEVPPPTETAAYVRPPLQPGGSEQKTVGRYADSALFSDISDDLPRTASALYRTL